MTTKTLARVRVFACFLCLAVAGPAGATTWTVSNTNDNGTGSLRQAIDSAASGDSIQFNVTGTITLTTGELLISNNLMVMGPGAAQLAVSGGGNSRVFEIGSGAIVTLSGLTIENGKSPGVGGGIYNDGTLTVTNSTVTGNSGENGGGIYNDGVTLTVTSSTITGNDSAVFGGGIFHASGTLTVKNSTIAGNQADGIFFGSGEGSLTNVTIAGNTTDILYAGGITTVPSGLSLAGTLLANNGGNCLGPIASQGYNLSDDRTCGASGLTATGDENNVVAGAGLDPKGLQNNGGPTQTIALLPGSPAVDHIPVASCMTTTDQRGVSRPQGNGCDVGAFELVQTIPFSSFTASLAIDTGAHPGFALNATFKLGAATSGLQPASEAMTLSIAGYMLTLPAGSFHPLWNGPNSPYVYEGTVNGATVALGVTPLGQNQFQFDAAGAPVSFPGVKNPVAVSLQFGNDAGATAVNAVITTF